MKSGICSKCQSSTVFMKKNGINVNKGLYVRASSVNAKSPFVTYICATCGYFENYIDDSAKLIDVMNKWDKVEPVDK